MNRNFQVDPTGLSPGAHSAYIMAYDTTAPGAGKVWEVAITVIRTEQLKTSPRMHVSHSNVFQPGAIRRQASAYLIFHKILINFYS